MTELAEAWNRGDAAAYGARYRADGTFTNVNGAFYVGREEFTRRHEEIFRGYLRGSTLGLAGRRLRFIRRDVVVADIDVSLSGVQAHPPGVQAWPDGTLHTCLLMVLVKEDGSWQIAAHGAVIAGQTIHRAVQAAIALVTNAEILTQSRILAGTHAAGELRFLSSAEISAMAELASSPQALQRMWEYWATRTGHDTG